jgi:hypothetical protein
LREKINRIEGDDAKAIKTISKQCGKLSKEKQSLVAQQVDALLVLERRETVSPQPMTFRNTSES